MSCIQSCSTCHHLSQESKQHAVELCKHVSSFTTDQSGEMSLAADREFLLEEVGQVDEWALDVVHHVGNGLEKGISQRVY